MVYQIYLHISLLFGGIRKPCLFFNRFTSSDIDVLLTAGQVFSVRWHDVGAGRPFARSLRTWNIWPKNVGYWLELLVNLCGWEDIEQLRIFGRCQKIMIYSYLIFDKKNDTSVFFLITNQVDETIYKIRIYLEDFSLSPSSCDIIV